MARKLTVNGKRGFTFRFQDGFKDKPVQLPCGKCIGCRLEYSRQWAIRCMHEAQLHEDNCFVTLTYDDDHLPPGGTLVPRNFTLFMKRLRKQFGAGIRFFHCGEYGSKLQRPHHHVLLFGHRFPDERPLQLLGQANPLRRSETLETLWPYGFSTIGDVTFETAAYVARYSIKKVNGSKAAEHYQGRHPEYLTMSRRPGIGSAWIHKWAGQVYRPGQDFVISGDQKTKPPRYYDKIAEKLRGKQLEKLKLKRVVAGKYSSDNTGKRLIDRETVKLAATSFLKREFENS